jgi:hypothetical protein
MKKTHKKEEKPMNTAVITDEQTLETVLEAL